uniref:DSBA-like thioredoxin domain-containing protein n=1 Tax=Ditylum brightwellii TaxID=49249 RepID=A0A7S4V792_9STRA|mmetsp:Transcript_4590/g.6113  ORF Transcript_4590/g.6113 Transcript_4590/m.6113 type:complete len:256 (+) Transcript_4590:67-834(+)
MTEVLSNPLPGAAHPLAFSVMRVPFFLEPHYDEKKNFIESNRERLIKKWGGEQGWDRQKRVHNLKGRGMDAGIPHFNLDRLASNTMASHRLIQHVGKRFGLRISEALYDRLNVYYFVDGHSLNDKPRLAKVAAEEINKLLNNDKTTANKNGNGETAIGENEILTFLNGNEGRYEIQMALRTLDDIGVHGIPKFIIEGRTVVDGAARSDTFVDIFRDIEMRGKIAGGPIFGEILGVSDDIIQRGSHSIQDLDAAAA